MDPNPPPASEQGSGATWRIAICITVIVVCTAIVAWRLARLATQV